MLERVKRIGHIMNVMGSASTGKLHATMFVFRVELLSAMEHVNMILRLKCVETLVSTKKNIAKEHVRVTIMGTMVMIGLTAMEMVVRIRTLTGNAIITVYTIIVFVYRLSRSAMKLVEMTSGIVILMMPALTCINLVMGPAVLGIFNVLITGIVLVAKTTGNVVIKMRA